MSQIKLSKRLSTVASLVRDGAIVADIGTDHAYLPIYLVQANIAKRAIASDINEGPIMRARANIEKNTLEDKIITYIANGLDGLEKHTPTDILICGMGGELIAQIIDTCDYVKNGDISLILQPMTTAFELREYLKNGFSIYDEEVVFEDGKYYQIICARYDGQVHSYSDVELELGSINIKKRTDTFLGLLDYTINKKKKILDGQLCGGCDTAKTEREINELEKLK